jgi:cytochrome oxidase Cu insertion factor (SCO1/SenC/PrrC family)
MDRVARRLDGCGWPAQDDPASAFDMNKEDSMLNPGDKAPDFTGRDHTGQTVKLSDFKGKPVVLWFFPKADTPG